MGWTPRRHHPCLRLRHAFPRMSGPRTGLSGEQEAREVVLEKAPLAAHEALVQSQSGSGTKASEDLELKLSFPHQQINEQAPSPSSSSPPAFGCPVLTWREELRRQCFCYGESEPRYSHCHRHGVIRGHSLRVCRVPWDCGLDPGCNMPTGTRRGNTDDQCPFRFIQIEDLVSGDVIGCSWCFLWSL